MGRKQHAPRLWLDQRPGRGWVILDRGKFIRTGFAESDRTEAEKELARYLGQIHQPPKRDGDPLIADVLNAYCAEHLHDMRSAKNTVYNVEAVVKWCGARKVSDIHPAACRDYALTKTPAAARRDLEVLRAAINYWHRHHGPLPVIPAVILPPKPEPRERWLTRDEVASLLWHARHTPHLARFILLAIYTGSRSGVLLNLEWSWIDLKHGVMSRRAPGASEAKNKRTPKVKLGDRILAHLRRWKRIDGKSGKYVCHYDGQKITKLRRSFPAAVKAAKLKGVTPHILRHSRATWLMKKRVNPWIAAQHLGMSVETLTKNYAHHHPDFQKEAAEV